MLKIKKIVNGGLFKMKVKLKMPCDSDVHKIIEAIERFYDARFRTYKVADKEFFDSLKVLRKLLNSHSDPTADTEVDAPTYAFLMNGTDSLGKFINFYDVDNKFYDTLLYSLEMLKAYVEEQKMNATIRSAKDAAYVEEAFARGDF